MVNSLEALVLHTVPLAVLLDLLQAVWHLPLRKTCVSALFRRSTTDELTRLAKQFPWDHPIARTLDHEIHRRKMAGKSSRSFLLTGLGSISSLIPFFSWFLAVFPDLDFLRQVLWPIHLCLCQIVRVENFSDSLDSLEDKPVRHIYQWVAHPTHGCVCNHCDRMMDGYTLEDLIFQRDCSLTEDNVVAYVRSSDPTNQVWDDWALRMTYRINSFLRANRDNPEPD